MTPKEIRPSTIGKTLLTLSTFASLAAFAGAGVGSGGGGDYLLLLKYARLLKPHDSIILDGELPLMNENAYRAELVSAARSGLRKMRQLLAQGVEFRYLDGTPVTFNTETLRKFAARIDAINDPARTKFQLVSGLRDEAGNPLTAKNYPSGRVELDPARWEMMIRNTPFSFQLSVVEAMSVHEVLSIDAVERSGEYPVASAVLARPDLPPADISRGCHSNLLGLLVGFSFPTSYGSYGMSQSQSTVCGSDGTRNRYLSISVTVTENKQRTSASVRFENKFKPGAPVRNAKLAERLDCALAFINSPYGLEMELDREDQVTDSRGERIKALKFKLPSPDDAQVVFMDRQMHHHLLEARLAKTPEERDAALRDAQRALGEALLLADELFSTKLAPALLEKYALRERDAYNRKFPQRLKQYQSDLKDWQEHEEERKKGPHSFNLLHYLFYGDGYYADRKERMPTEPQLWTGDPLGDLKACGYFHPEAPGSTSTP